MNFDIEIWQYTIVSLLITVSAISKAVQDKLSWHYSTSIFSKLNPKWWNEQIAWNNKYQWSSNKFISYLLQTVLVSFTSAWHTFGLLRDFTLFSTIPIISQNYYLFLAYIPYRLVFHIFYTYIFTKK